MDIDDSSIGVLYKFLIEKARREEEFSKTDLESVMSSWTGATAQTYVGKQLRTILVKRGKARYTVKRAFLEVSIEQFKRLISQKEIGLAEYQRVSHDQIVTFELLLPLANEDELRRTLDRLFYKDLLRKRVENISPIILESFVPRVDAQSDSQYHEYAFRKISDLFWGYSISHVSGRFRAGASLTQQEAIGNRYIVDETTAVVRFIFPCKAGRREHSDYFSFSDNLTSGGTSPRVEEESELHFIRRAFIEVFAELIVVRVLKEDEIWILENSKNENRLYIWRKNDA